MTIKTIGKDEKATLTRQVFSATKRAKVTHTVRPNKDDPNRYQLTWTLDFKNCNDEQILELATRSAVIMIQADWRGSANRMDEKVWDNATFDVAAILAEGRKSADPALKAKNALAKLKEMDPEAFAALMKEVK